MNESVCFLQCLFTVSQEIHNLKNTFDSAEGRYCDKDMELPCAHKISIFSVLRLSKRFFF